MRRIVYFVILPLVLLMVVIYTKGKGGVKRFYWYVYWTTIIYFSLGVIRYLWVYFNSRT
jgi:hypothetical protein